MAGGYIKLYRQLLENPVVCKDADHYAIWGYLLLSAAHDNYDIVFGKERITLKPGQLITSRKSISDRFHINESKCERVLILFKNEQMIEQQTSSKNRLITILKWSDYQSNEQVIEQQVNNKRTTSEQQVNTNKNVKNIKNVKKNKKKDIEAFINFANGDAKLLEALMLFVQMRNDKKKPMTPGAQKLLINKLIDFRENGEDIIECLNTSVINSWLSIYPSKNKKSNQFIGNDSKSGSRALDMLMDMEVTNE